LKISIVRSEGLHQRREATTALEGIFLDEKLDELRAEGFPLSRR